MAKIPEEIGKYKILSCLGSGGTSIVYTATHPTLKRKVVLKKLNLRGNRQYYEGFRQEAALMMDLNHDNIVRVFDHFKEGSRHYIVMEFVEGCSLDEILNKGGALPPGTCRYILECCCRALEYIHSRNIIHRDIKPSNIFISRTGDVKLGDFGIAGTESDNGTSGEFTPVGTPSYMAPEQFIPHARISGRTDIYALGVTLYEMLTAEKLFDGASLDELKRKILKSRHVSLLKALHSRGLPLYWIVKRCSFRRPAFRFKTVRPVFKFLKLVAPSVRNSDSRVVLTVLVESMAGVKKKSSGRRSESLPAAEGKKGAGRRRVWPLILILFLITAATLFLTMRTGSFYRLFSQGSKGALQVRIASGDKVSVQTGDMRLYRDKSQYLEPVKSFDLSDKSGLSEIWYLDTGNYRALVRRGSQVQWILFYLPPQEKQDEPEILEITSPDIPRKPLTIRKSVKDALSRSDLSGRTVLSAQKAEDRWIPVDELLLMTGEAYRLRVECEGYYSRYLNVPLQFYQDLLKIEVEMIPLPGKLVLHHEPGTLVMRVNGKERLPGGDEERSLISFGRIPEGESQWLLSPGKYEIEWESGSAFEKEILVIESTKVYSYTIQHMDDSLTISPY